MAEKTKAELEKELEEVKTQVAIEKAKEETKVPEVPGIETKEAEEQIVVVKEIPTVETRVGYINDGKDKVSLITIDEAITEIYKDMKALRKGVG